MVRGVVIIVCACGIKSLTAVPLYFYRLCYAMIDLFRNGPNPS